MRAMYKGTILGMLSLAIVITSFTFAMTPDVEESHSSDYASVFGHMVLTVTDKDGNVIAFRESDNTIVVGGMTLLGNNTFGNPGAVVGLSEAGGPVTQMAIGTDETDITNPNAATITFLADPNCLPVPSTFTGNAGVSSTTGTAQVNVSATSAFLGANCGGEQIDEAGMFTDAGVLFARNTFAFVPQLGPADTLTIGWNFTFTDQVAGIGGMG